MSSGTSWSRSWFATETRRQSESQSLPGSPGDEHRPSRRLVHLDQWAEPSACRGPDAGRVMGHDRVSSAGSTSGLPRKEASLEASGHDAGHRKGSTVPDTDRVINKVDGPRRARAWSPSGVTGRSARRRAIVTRCRLCRVARFPAKEGSSACRASRSDARGADRDQTQARPVESSVGASKPCTPLASVRSAIPDGASLPNRA